MRHAFLLLFASIVLRGADFEDSRNTDVRHPHTHYSLPSYSSRAAWESRKWQLRQQILFSAGLIPAPPRNALNVRIADRIDKSSYIVETLILETLPGFYLWGTLYRPSMPGRYPAVLLPHGHWRGGRLENRPSYSVPALGVNLALQGYVAFSYDMVGYNETHQMPHAFGGWREQLWSFNPLGLQLWNSMRSVDFLASRQDVDSKRIAATGASGGATQTILLAAVDTRVQYSAPVNMVSATMQGGDACEEAPNLRLNGANNVEFTAMAAPRPMLVVSCTQDWTRNTPIEEYPFLRRIYALYKSTGAVGNAHFDAEHNYNSDSRNAVYQFFASASLHNRGPLDWYRDRLLPELDSLLQPARHLPRGVVRDSLNYEELVEDWVSSARSQNEETSERDVLREHLRLALGATWPSRVSGALLNGRVILTRPGAGDRVPAIWSPGNGNPVVIVHPDGADAARSSRIAQELLKTRRPLLAIDAFQTGFARAPRASGGRWFLSYNQTDDANRVQDILTALSFARDKGKGKLKLIGLEGAGVWCTFAAAVAPVEVELMADLSEFNGSDEDFHRHFFVPGIQRAGGLEAALKLIRKGRPGWERPS